MRLKFFAIFIVLFFGIYLYRFSVPVWALSCLIPEDRYFAYCEGLNCTEGFMIQEKSTGNWCGGRPVVVKEERQQVVDFMDRYISSKNIILEKGIYQLNVSLICRDLSYRRCEPNSELVKVASAEGSDDFESFLNKWERNEFYSLIWVHFVKWVVFILIIALVGSLVYWPSKMLIKGDFSLLSIILFNLFVRLPVWFLGIGMVTWSYKLWQFTGWLAGMVFLVSGLGEIVYWLYKRFYKK